MHVHERVVDNEKWGANWGENNEHHHVSLSHSWRVYFHDDFIMSLFHCWLLFFVTEAEE